jgi:DNA-binding MarR family transcriptional regulator
MVPYMGSHKAAATAATAPRREVGGGRQDVRSILDSIRRIVRALRVASRAAEKEVGLTGAQLFVLHHLAEAPALSLNDLAERTKTHQSSVSVVVQRLVDRGLVARERSGSDARRVELTLTTQARALLRKSPGAAQDRLIDAVERMPPTSRRRLAGLLDGLVRDIGADEGAVPMLFEEETGADRNPAAARARRRRGRGQPSEPASPGPGGARGRGSARTFD